ncbi:hypothetical protein APR12_002597, partial [Nocardia amikacinitolerans]|nr:hypothetical protein [Nocardia amikacinitolerans]
HLATSGSPGCHPPCGQWPSGLLTPPCGQWPSGLLTHPVGSPGRHRPCDRRPTGPPPTSWPVAHRAANPASRPTAHRANTPPRGQRLTRPPPTLRPVAHRAANPASRPTAHRAATDLATDGPPGRRPPCDQRPTGRHPPRDQRPTGPPTTHSPHPAPTTHPLAHPLPTARPTQTGPGQPTQSRNSIGNPNSGNNRSVSKKKFSPEIVSPSSSSTVIDHGTNTPGSSLGL